MAQSEPLVKSGIIAAEIRLWLRGRGRYLHVVNITSDLGVPVFVAITADAHGGRISYGFGADFDARSALRLSLTEMLQIEIQIALIEKRSEQQPVSRSVARILHWLSVETLKSQRHLVPADQPAVQIDQLATRNGKKGGIDECLATCRKHGLRMLFVDLTRSDIGVPAARVAVPGLEACAGAHYWAHQLKALGHEVV